MVPTPSKRLRRYLQIHLISRFSQHRHRRPQLSTETVGNLYLNRLFGSIESTRLKIMHAFNRAKREMQKKTYNRCHI
jgi:hypothetical protein